MATITLDLIDQHGEIMRLILAKTSGLTDTDNPKPNDNGNSNDKNDKDTCPITPPTPPNKGNGDDTPNGTDTGSGDKPNDKPKPSNPPNKPKFVDDDGKVTQSFTSHAVFYANLGGRAIDNNSWINAVKSGDWSRLKYYNPFNEKTHNIGNTYILVSKSLEKIADTMVEKQYQYSEDVMPIYQEYTSAHFNRTIINSKNIEEPYEQSFSLEPIKVAVKYDKNGDLQYVTSATNEKQYFLLNRNYDGNAGDDEYSPSKSAIPLIDDIEESASIIDFNNDWTNDNPIDDDITEDIYGIEAKIEFALNPNVFYEANASVGKDIEKYTDKQGYQQYRLVSVPINSYIVNGINGGDKIEDISLYQKWFCLSINSNYPGEAMPSVELSPFQKIDVEGIIYHRGLDYPLFANNTVSKQRVSHKFNVGDDYFDLYPFADNQLIEIN